ncbi:sulfotransferase family protein [Ancylobacter sp. MQZ15Z-1]|uniref:Sulfotransferase family protein n=1 Tax=Ancylobacter mangrovi TaxID=2972472 RepID=A0A9X2T548_9HYPH|nr:sulfotransferase family protein [Ancylobacter mangrovi]MCS0496881.1 sulfotransferase family protein [Ancylobacter mangrovi]
MWGFIVDRIGSRKAADIKEALVVSLPSPILRALNNRIVNFVPQPFYAKSAIFVHVPKAAGTSIAVSLYGSRVSHQPAELLRKADPQFWSSAYKFSVVRDPYERVLSAYHYLRIGGTEEAPIDDRRDMRDVDLSTFENMIYWLEKNFHNIRKYNYVLWPQYWFVCDQAGRIMVDDIFKVENMPDLQRELNARGLISGAIPHVNASRNSNKSARDILDEDIKRRIFSMYRRDFEMFGYMS